MGIKQIGETIIAPRHRASCHCGAVVLELELPDGIERPIRCDCSLCRRKGAIMGAIPVSRLHVLQGQEVLRLYQFHSHTAKHYFCSVCGVYTHHQRRSDPNECGFNIGCLEGVNPFELGEVPVANGTHHPSDR
ncbi:aldehyde-activating protein [Pokkaliibacter plantistimulans]|uniref:Aldehyde-activating protein n=2 Tax=Pseudomonadota TaxID=1224 RepID=A0ABX5M2P1_9GAMM|nr:GFA family protein [Pokkaliibacter plantistimulans]PPC74241.1 aldehyde-activating protein [Pokkaliibacter plantistimulans]PXF33157.1 aldehyde-activating protein [Pokkaliibacter plantistimulans]